MAVGSIFVVCFLIGIKTLFCATGRKRSNELQLKAKEKKKGTSKSITRTSLQKTRDGKKHKKRE
jgi:hypothetical protein